MKPKFPSNDARTRRRRPALRRTAQLLIAAAIFFSLQQPAFSKSAPASFPAGGAAWRRAPAQVFLRTELYFGRNKPDGSEVAEADWEKFLETEVTPRFPDGYTVLDGAGRFRDAAGRVVVEKSKVLVLLYPARQRKAASRKVERIRQAYKQAFSQQSVLRFDLAQTVRVSF